jgi:hypothetical protein
VLKKTKRERYLVDFVPAHFAITVVIGQRQVTVIVAFISDILCRLPVVNPVHFGWPFPAFPLMNRRLSRWLQCAFGSVESNIASSCRLFRNLAKSNYTGNQVLLA